VSVVIALAAMHQSPLFHMDIYNAFLQGDLEEDIYMQLPPGFSSQGGILRAADCSNAFMALSKLQDNGT